MAFTSDTERVEARTQPCPITLNKITSSKFITQLAYKLDVLKNNVFVAQTKNVAKQSAYSMAKIKGHSMSSSTFSNSNLMKSIFNPCI